MIFKGRACFLIRPRRYARTRTNQTTPHYAETLTCIRLGALDDCRVMASVEKEQVRSATAAVPRVTEVG